jgi:hypothetical protein
MKLLLNDKGLTEIPDNYNYITVEYLQGLSKRELINLVIELQWEFEDKQQLKKQIKEWEQIIDRLNSRAIVQEDSILAVYLERLANETMAINI